MECKKYEIFTVVIDVSVLVLWSVMVKISLEYCGILPNVVPRFARFCGRHLGDAVKCWARVPAHTRDLQQYGRILELWQQQQATAAKCHGRRCRATSRDLARRPHWPARLSQLRHELRAVRTRYLFIFILFIQETSK